MDIFAVFSLAGGLALFLYGMNVLGEGLERQAGGKLKTVLEKMTSNKFKGLALGVAVTAMIQSSSATTVMVVGFVNAGIMKLTQAISIIIGANIGTTITAWILSLAGLEGSSMFVRLLKPASFSPILAFIGIIFTMFSKKESRKGLGTIFLGFAILMFGMETMSASVAPLSNDPSFTNLFTYFTNPFLGLLVGAAVTAIIQSSSASVGILQALSATGSITFGAAIPIILGQNIGTCVTALISSVGTNKNARRAAVVHLYFNIIGTSLFFALFYIINHFFPFSFYNQSIDHVGIAIVHTIFNIVATCAILPFTKWLEKLAYLTIKDTTPDQDVQILDERFLATPAVALSQCQKLTVCMAKLSQSSLLQSISLIGKYNERVIGAILEAEDQVDMYEDRLGSYLIKLSSRSLTMEDSHEISKLLHVMGDLERISDHAVNIMYLAKEKYTKGYTFSKEGLRELEILSSAVTEIINLTCEAFIDDNLDTATMVEPLEQVIDWIKDELHSRHIERLQRGECNITIGFVFSDLITNFERISDHCSNIAVALLRIAEDTFDTHEYLSQIKGGHNDNYETHYAEYKEKYSLASSGL